MEKQKQRRRNVLEITLTLTPIGLSWFKRTPAFNRMLHANQVDALQVGDNQLTVNHTVWGTLQRLADPEGNIIVKRK